MDLSQLVLEAEKDKQFESEKEAKEKIRYVMQQVSIFEHQLKKNGDERDKIEKRLKKAQDKLDQLRAGNMEVLKQIDPKNPQKEEDEK